MINFVIQLVIVMGYLRHHQIIKKIVRFSNRSCKTLKWVQAKRNTSVLLVYPCINKLEQFSKRRCGSCKSLKWVQAKRNNSVLLVSTCIKKLVQFSNRSCGSCKSLKWVQAKQNNPILLVYLCIKKLERFSNKGCGSCKSLGLGQTEQICTLSENVYSCLYSTVKLGFASLASVQVLTLLKIGKHRHTEKTQIFDTYLFLK